MRRRTRVRAPRATRPARATVRIPRRSWLRPLKWRRRATPVSATYLLNHTRTIRVVSRYDALLVLSFGGPEKHEDVIPFLENVLRGRNVPRERMLEVAEHYYHFDGRSPINDQNRALVAALKEVVEDPGLLGQSQLASDAGRHRAADARRRNSQRHRVRHFGVWILFRLPPVCRRCRSSPRGGGRGGAAKSTRIRPFSAHPAFIEAMTDRVRAAIGRSVRMAA